MATSERAQKVKEITEQMEQGITDLFEAGNFQRYLDTLAKFHNYSFRNTILIYLQMPSASYVAGFSRWKKLKRSVKKGERAIKIFAPCGSGKASDKPPKDDDDTNTVKNSPPTFFTTANVFDISQTEGEPLDLPCQTSIAGDVQNYSALLEALESIAPVPVEFEEIKNGASGYYMKDKRIAIQRGMSEQFTVSTLIHEITHATLHNRDKLKDEKKDRRTREVEAESVAYTTCKHFGIDTSAYSFDYIGHWGSGRDMKELKASMTTIRDTACYLIDSIEAGLGQIALIEPHPVMG